MSVDLLFSISQSLALFGWGLLLFVPRWKSSVWINERVIIPVLLAGIYLALIATNINNISGGFSSISEIRQLFENDYLLLAGWVHYLAFDLFVGIWLVHHSRKFGYVHALIIFPLLLTFLAGPAGLLLYFLIHSFQQKSLLNMNLTK